MDLPLVNLGNICILGVIFGLSAFIVDSQEPSQRPVFSPPPPPPPSVFTSPPPPPPPPSPTFSPPPPPPTFSPPPPPPTFSPPPPPWQSPPPVSPPPPQHPPSPAATPSNTPRNRRPFVSAPPPEHTEDTHHNAGETNTRVGKKIGWIFLGVAIIIQAFVVIFLIIRRRQLFNA